MNAQVPIIRASGEGDKRAFLGGGLHTWKLTTDDTEGAFFVFEDVMVQGKTTPLHRHPEADETVYILEGEILVNHDGKTSRVGAGGLLFTPKGVPHAFLVVSDQARLLTLQTPGIGQAFYRGASEPATDDTSETVDIARIQASAKENPRAIEILGPPPFERSSDGSVAVSPSPNRSVSSW
ncbi:MAG TPA: cupin domain-containing protein [Acidimicrobiia bacterium]|nr:cupin domain-containing protein [Acidimicrobiia bacterium]